MSTLGKIPSFLLIIPIILVVVFISWLKEDTNELGKLAVCHFPDYVGHDTFCVCVLCNF